jgi:D-cysteine desulfhydrase
MNLARFSRRRYTCGATPLQRLDRLTEFLNGPRIYIKRDDLLGLAGGGNKFRKLEFLVADALAQSADTLITVGAVQSNHCRATLAAAVREGLKCRLVIEERVCNSYKAGANGNNFLFRLLGVESITVVPGGSNLPSAMADVTGKVRAEGGTPYVIPGGGSNPLGATGYVACAEEILAQCFERGVHLDHAIVASGSGGTHAGLLAGFSGNNTGISVIGVSVRNTKQCQEELIFSLTNRTAAHVGCPEVARSSVLCFDEYVGPGYSLPTPEMIQAVKLLARTEGILLDPVYTGKAMAGLIDLVRKGYFRKGQNVVFVHTGGEPALYAYADYFNEDSCVQDRERAAAESMTTA